jgi:predicted RNA-binding protein Jag
MPSLKDLFMEIDSAISEENGDNSLEVYADSVKQALELAAKELNVDISALDYEIVEKGTKGFFGIGRLPYRVIVTPIKLSTVEMTELDELDSKFSGSHIPGISLQKEDSDGIYKIRVTKNGVMLKVIPQEVMGQRLHLKVSKTNSMR